MATVLRRGPRGLPGDPGPPGDPGLTWVGTWDVLNHYAVNYGVEFEGSSYISLEEIFGDPGNLTPPEDYRWQMLAQKGDDGDPGGGGGGGAPAINMPEEWDYGGFAALAAGVLVDPDHPCEVRVVARVTLNDLAGSTLEALFFVAADDSKQWRLSDIIRQKRNGGTGAGTWESDFVVSAIVPAGGYVQLSVSQAFTGAGIGPGLYNWASKRRLD